MGNTVNFNDLEGLVKIDEGLFQQVANPKVSRKAVSLENIAIAYNAMQKYNSYRKLLDSNEEYGFLLLIGEVSNQDHYNTWDKDIHLRSTPVDMRDELDRLCEYGSVVAVNSNLNPLGVNTKYQCEDYDAMQEDARRFTRDSSGRVTAMVVSNRGTEVYEHGKEMLASPNSSLYNLNKNYARKRAHIVKVLRVMLNHQIL